MREEVRDLEAGTAALEEDSGRAPRARAKRFFSASPRCRTGRRYAAGQQPYGIAHRSNNSEGHLGVTVSTRNVAASTLDM